MSEGRLTCNVYFPLGSARHARRKGGFRLPLVIVSVRIPLCGVQSENPKKDNQTSAWQRNDAARRCMLLRTRRAAARTEVVR